MTRDASSGSKGTDYDMWMIDEPPSIASNSTWEEHLKSLRGLAKRHTHPDIDAAIARAEAILRNPSVFAPRKVWEDHLEGLRRLAKTNPHPDVDQDIAKAEEKLSWVVRWGEAGPPRTSARGKKAE